jgi:hypothetical protein
MQEDSPGQSRTLQNCKSVQSPRPENHSPDEPAFELEVPSQKAKKCAVQHIGGESPIQDLAEYRFRAERISLVHILAVYAINFFPAASLWSR